MLNDLFVPDPPAGDSSNQIPTTRFVANNVASAIATTVAAIPIAATQSDMEAKTSTAVFVSPGRQQFHPSSPKAWLYSVLTTGVPALTAGYNISSITDSGVGILDITFGVAMSTANYMGMANGGGATGAQAIISCGADGVRSTTGDRMTARNSTGTLVDPSGYNYIACGDQ